MSHPITFIFPFHRNVFIFNSDSETEVLTFPCSDGGWKPRSWELHVVNEQRISEGLGEKRKNSKQKILCYDNIFYRNFRFFLLSHWKFHRFFIAAFQGAFRSFLIFHSAVDPSQHCKANSQH